MGSHVQPFGVAQASGLRVEQLAIQAAALHLNRINPGQMRKDVGVSFAHPDLSHHLAGQTNLLGQRRAAHLAWSGQDLAGNGLALFQAPHFPTST
jgi:hypothetical protein